MQELFDTNSITVNKQGKKSEAQIKEIKDAVKPSLWLWVGLAMLVFGGCFFAFLISMESGAASFFGLLIGGVGLFAALRSASSWNLRRKLLTEPVLSAEGTVTFKVQNAIRQFIDVDHYIARTNDGRKLSVLGLEGTSPKLPPGSYRFYFLKTRNWLLAAEPLTGEAELLANLNHLLTEVMGFDLEEVRQRASLGQLQTFEGQPKLETEYEQSYSGDDSTAITHYFLALGEFRFEITPAAYMAILPALKHRLYYRAGETNTIAGMEAF